MCVVNRLVMCASSLIFHTGVHQYSPNRGRVTNRRKFWKKTKKVSEPQQLTIDTVDAAGAAEDIAEAVVRKSFPESWIFDNFTMNEGYRKF